MITADHAVMVGPHGTAWEWRLVDRQGRTVAYGRAATQRAAMEMAWDEVRLPQTVAAARYDPLGMQLSRA